MFQMFVRLFVDENLDRIVPISKQPKEKIQAIIDSCTRQFPEFAERARKRIRTYLKSCRRNKRARDPGNWPEAVSKTHVFLTCPALPLTQKNIIKHPYPSVANLSDSLTLPISQGHLHHLILSASNL